MPGGHREQMAHGERKARSIDSVGRSCGNSRRRAVVQGESLADREPDRGRGEALLTETSCADNSVAYGDHQPLGDHMPCLTTMMLREAVELGRLAA
jgi:hypothetical protein